MNDYSFKGTEYSIIKTKIVKYPYDNFVKEVDYCLLIDKEDIAKYKKSKFVCVLTYDDKDFFKGKILKGEYQCDFMLSKKEICHQKDIDPDLFIRSKINEILSEWPQDDL